MSVPHRAAIAWSALAAAALSVIGCERVGSSLVEHEDPIVERTPSAVCTPAPPCDEAAIALPDDKLHKRAIAPACGRQLPSCPDTASQDDDAGAVWLPEGCLVVAGEDELATNTRSVNCANRFIEIEKPASDETTELSGVDWQASNIGFSSRDPWTIELDGAAMQDVLIRLSGPVTVRITHAAKLENVRVASGEPASAQPALELLEVNGGLIVGGTEQPFHGTVRATRTMLTTPQLIADRIELESVTFKDAIIEADDLEASDASITNATFSLGNAVISASTLFNVHVRSCGSLALLDDDASNMRVPACSKPPLRVYRTKVVRGIIDGEIDSDLSSWTRVAFGLHSPTNLVAWAASVQSSKFCSNVESLKFGANSMVGCSTCIEDGPETCVIPPMPPELSKNYCPVLKKAPACEEPLPVRDHPEPITNFF